MYEFGSCSKKLSAVSAHNGMGQGGDSWIVCVALAFGVCNAPACSIFYCLSHGIFVGVWPPTA